jgi:hypothetical protein
VPVLDRYSRQGVFPNGHFYLMRRRDLGLAPKLALEIQGRRLRVHATHRSHPQLVDLRVQLVERDGTSHNLRPDGSLDSPTDIEVRAVLRNPNAVGDSIFSFASAEVSASIEQR